MSEYLVQFEATIQADVAHEGDDSPCEEEYRVGVTNALLAGNLPEDMRVIFAERAS